MPACPCKISCKLLRPFASFQKKKTFTCRQCKCTCEVSLVQTMFQNHVHCTAVGHLSISLVLVMISPFQTNYASQHVQFKKNGSSGKKKKLACSEKQKPLPLQEAGHTPARPSHSAERNPASCALSYERCARCQRRFQCGEVGRKDATPTGTTGLVFPQVAVGSIFPFTKPRFNFDPMPCNNKFQESATDALLFQNLYGRPCFLLSLYL